MLLQYIVAVAGKYFSEGMGAEGSAASFSILGLYAGAVSFD